MLRTTTHPRSVLGLPLVGADRSRRRTDLSALARRPVVVLRPLLVPALVAATAAMAEAEAETATTAVQIQSQTSITLRSTTTSGRSTPAANGSQTSVSTLGWLAAQLAAQTEAAG